MHTYVQTDTLKSICTEIMNKPEIEKVGIHRQARKILIFAKTGMCWEGVMMIIHVFSNDFDHDFVK